MSILSKIRQVINPKVVYLVVCHHCNNNSNNNNSDFIATQYKQKPLIDIYLMGGTSSC